MKVTNDLVRSRLDKLAQLASRGIAPYAYSCDVTHRSREILDDAATFAERGETVRIAGRLVARRPMGKAGFGHLLDRDGRIQVYFKRDDLGADAFDLWKLLDVGDWIWVEGAVFQTRTGEWTVAAHRISLLSKSLMPLPEKWHGLRDRETRYRQRYVDLVMNEEVRAVFRLRARLVSAIR
ncbi:MAG: OB-fold nucleic acid binding domain-containing protein, partial [Candidatus Eiseniibacteriota bacterium]